jgi:hypothetical protein
MWVSGVEGFHYGLGCHEHAFCNGLDASFVLVAYKCYADSGHLWVWGYDGCADGELPVQKDAWGPCKVLGQLATKKVVAFDVGEWEGI